MGSLSHRSSRCLDRETPPCFCIARKLRATGYAARETTSFSSWSSARANQEPVQRWNHDGRFFYLKRNADGHTARRDRRTALQRGQSRPGVAFPRTEVLETMGSPS